MINGCRVVINVLRSKGAVRPLVAPVTNAYLVYYPCDSGIWTSVIARRDGQFLFEAIYNQSVNSDYSYLHTKIVGELQCCQSGFNFFTRLLSDFVAV